MVLIRIFASLISIIVRGAIFYIKNASKLTDGEAYELDLILLAGSFGIITVYPGRYH